MLLAEQEYSSNILDRFTLLESPNKNIETNSIEEKVKILIIRDLLRLGWDIFCKGEKLIIQPPTYYDKTIILESMEIKRNEILFSNRDWINQHLSIGKANLASGNDAWNSEIIPSLQICKSQKDFDLFRLFRYSWSSPYSEYVGRRIKYIIRDDALPNRPVIGIAAMGSSIIHIPERDKWVGWDKKTRSSNLIYTMDLYVLGALPPYNKLLGGKLISYIMASNEVRESFTQKYQDSITKISKRTCNTLACLFTTSLYGKSVQYNRINYDGKHLYHYIGETKGYGTLHITNETFEAMRELLHSKGIVVSNSFGDGPIWRMRVIRTASSLIGIDPDILLNHSFRRGIYSIPLANNYKEFLCGNDTSLHNYDYSMDSLTRYWKEKWLSKRKKSEKIREEVITFTPDQFSI